MLGRGDPHALCFPSMPSRKAAPPPAPAELPTEQLYETVTDLTQHVRVLIDVLDDIREDLNWITRNGIPGGRPLKHTRLVRMARDPFAPDAREHLELRTYTLEPHDSPVVMPDVFEALVSEIAEAMTVVGQEQLNMLLTALDDARTKLMAAIKNPASKPAGDQVAPELQPVSSPSATTTPSEPTEPGCLF